MSHISEGRFNAKMIDHKSLSNAVFPLDGDQLNENGNFQLHNKLQGPKEVLLITPIPCFHGLQFENSRPNNQLDFNRVITK